MYRTRVMEVLSGQNFVYRLFKDKTPSIRHQRLSQSSLHFVARTLDAERKVRRTAISLCTTILACSVTSLLQFLSLTGDDWGRYEVREELLHESGHFGLFGVCIRSLQKNIFTDGCAVGQIGKFVLPAWCAISGICGVLCLFTAIICMLTASIQLFRLVRNEPPFCRNSQTLSQKAIFAIFIVIFACICLAFATLAMRRTVASSIHYGSTFWIQVTAVLLSVITLVSSVVESLWRPYPSLERLSHRDAEQRAAGRKQSFFPQGSFEALESLEMMIHNDQSSKPHVIVNALYEEKLATDRTVIRHDAYRRSISDAPAILAKVY